MPYVPVPKDLTKVKTKVAFNLTKRQLICFGASAVIGVPMYFLTKGLIGNTPAVLLMIVLMLPGFFMGMYEKNGQPAETLMKNYFRSRLFPYSRPYRTDNLYKRLSAEEDVIAQTARKEKAPRRSGKKSTAKRKE